MTRTVAIGLDGVSWNVLEPLLETGRLPNLAGLRDEGAHGVLESTIPFYTGPAWASFATGASPPAHGVYDFRMMREGDAITPASAADLRRRTYYELLAGEGVKSVVVNLPLDQDESPDAVIVNSWLTVDDARRIFPLDRRERYRQAVSAYRSYPTTFRAGLDTHLRDLCELEESRFALVRELFRSEDWGHFFVLFSSTDWLGHAATGLFLDGDEAARRAFVQLYQQLDGYVGWLREQAPDATFVVLSDHGQCEETHLVRVNGVLRELGLVKLVRERPHDVTASLSGERVRGTVRVPVAFRRLGQRRVLRPVTQRLRRTLQRTLRVDLLTPEHGFDADRVLSRAFTPTISSYAVYTNDCDAEDLDRIRGALAELRLDAGRPAFDGIWTLPELYGREPAPPAPTFFYAPAVGVRPAIDVGTPFVQRVPVAGRGAHQRDGIVLVGGADVRSTELGRASLLDLCPTLLWSMDAPLPAGSDGRVLYEAFTAEAAASRDVREVDATVESRTPVHAAASPEIERRLRDLGYLE
jgi:predicted AlkP superfamily phosphohydrolase/phosphomutase